MKLRQWWGGKYLLISILINLPFKSAHSILIFRVVLEKTVQSSSLEYMLEHSMCYLQLLFREEKTQSSSQSSSFRENTFSFVTGCFTQSEDTLSQHIFCVSITLNQTKHKQKFPKFKKNPLANFANQTRQFPFQELREGREGATPSKKAITFKKTFYFCKLIFHHKKNKLSCIQIRIKIYRWCRFILTRSFTLPSANKMLLYKVSFHFNK